MNLVVIWTEKDIEKINDDLEDKFYGWYLDSTGKNKYFLSIFSRENFSQELIFEVDFSYKTSMIRDGFRSREDKEGIEIKKDSKYFKEANKVAKYIKTKYFTE